MPDTTIGILPTYFLALVPGYLLINILHGYINLFTVFFTVFLNFVHYYYYLASKQQIFTKINL